MQGKLGKDSALTLSGCFDLSGQLSDRVQLWPSLRQQRVKQTCKQALHQSVPLAAVKQKVLLCLSAAPSSHTRKSFLFCPMH